MNSCAAMNLMENNYLQTDTSPLQIMSYITLRHIRIWQIIGESQGNANRYIIEKLQALGGLPIHGVCKKCKGQLYPRKRRESVEFHCPGFKGRLKKCPIKCDFTRVITADSYFQNGVISMEARCILLLNYLANVDEKATVDQVKMSVRSVSAWYMWCSKLVNEIISSRPEPIMTMAEIKKSNPEKWKSMKSFIKPRYMSKELIGAAISKFTFVTECKEGEKDSFIEFLKEARKLFFPRYEPEYADDLDTFWEIENEELLNAENLQTEEDLAKNKENGGGAEEINQEETFPVPVVKKKRKRIF